jgi:hypothetical protein
MHRRICCWVKPTRAEQVSKSWVGISRSYTQEEQELSKDNQSRAGEQELGMDNQIIIIHRRSRSWVKPTRAEQVSKGWVWISRSYTGGADVVI